MTPASPPSATDWRIVWLTVAAGVVAAFQIGKVPAALPVLREEFALGLVGAGWVLSIFNVIGVFGGMVLGAFIDRAGHRRMIIAGLLLIALAGVLGALAPAAPLLFAGRCLEGLGFTIVVVGGPGVLVRAATPRDLRLAFGLWGSYMPTGMASMLVASPALIDLIGWRGLWLVNAALMTIFAIVLAASTRGLGRGGSTADWSGLALTLKARGPWLLALGFAAYTLQFLAVMGFLPIILADEAGASPALAAALTALAVAVNVIGTLLGGWLLYHHWPRWQLIAGTSVLMAVAALAIYSPFLSVTWRYLACLAFSAIGGVLPTAVLSGSAPHAPRPNLVATTNGLIMQGSNLGQSLGPPAVAALATATGSWTWSPAVLIASAAVSILFALALRRLENAPGRTH
ncbi:MAG: MFS transporter [Proteobacteria bacterium]|nr:MFS transporter [Pseudomonadota bacterium]MBI3499183.1 MFS transporter [Pseudomonadota bacterium]